MSGSRAAFRLLLLAIALAPGAPSGLQSGEAPVSFPFMDPDLPLEVRVDDLVSRLTLEEKAAQMAHQAPALPRLGIPAYNWWSECLHGVARAGLATVFPQPIGLGAAFDEEAVRRMAGAIAAEARAKHHQALRRGEHGIYQGLTFFSPNVNLFRDPRWGRGMETFGEDPHLSSRLGVAFVRGLQGDDPSRLMAAATAKHFAVHSGPESERHRIDVHPPRRDLLESYLPAFAALVKEGRVAAVMCAYNRLYGDPCCGSPYLNTELLRRQWGFDGFVVSDCWAVDDFWERHRVNAGREEAVARAVLAGTDLECGNSYPALAAAVRNGRLTEAALDTALKRSLAVRFRLGMFDPPERVPHAAIPIAVVGCDSHRRLAGELAAKSMVLLKNRGGLLPFAAEERRTILVCGPNADQAPVLWGNYNGTPAATVTPLDGIRSRAPASWRVLYERGCDWTEEETPEPVPAACVAAGGRPGWRAEWFDNEELRGEPLATSHESGIDWETEGGGFGPLGRATSFSARFQAELTAPAGGTYRFRVRADDGVRLWADDDLLADAWEKPTAGWLQATRRLERGQRCRLRLEYRQHEWGARLRLAWIPPGETSGARALAAARRADVIVACAGITPQLEGEEMGVDINGFRGGDRTRLELPEVQRRFLRRLKATGKPVVLVLFNGGALALPWERERLDAIVEAWYPGQEGGAALAGVLFGDVNPSGRLPVTFYRSTRDLPAFEDYRLEGRTYRYFRGRPLFPFGFGLSYTRFGYRDLVLDRPQAEAGGSVTVRLRLRNDGPRDGEEVVQLYVRPLPSATADGAAALKGFARVALRASEERRVEMRLRIADLERYDPLRDALAVMPGRYEVMVGASSEDIRLRAPLTVTAAGE